MIYAISFLDLFAVGLTFPVFSTHLRDLGVSHYVIGLLGSTYSGTQVLSGPIIGGWSDVRGRKAVLQTTVVLCALLYGLLGFTSNITLIFIIRFLLGVFKHNQSLCKAAITDLVPSKDQTAVFGRSSAFASIGFIAGPFLGGHLMDLPNGYSLVSLLATLLFIVNFFLVYFLPDKIFNKTSKNQRRINFKLILKDFSKTFTELKSIEWGQHWCPFLIRFLFGTALSAFLGNQALFLQENYQLSKKQIGYVISYFSTIGTMSGFFLDRINALYRDDVKCFTRLRHFFFLMFVCLIGIYLSTNLWTVFVLLVPLSIAASILRNVSIQLLLQQSKKSESGSFAGAANSVMSIARFCVPFFSGVVADVFGEKNAILFGRIGRAHV